jgi:hypothetical protein
MARPCLCARLKDLDTILSQFHPPPILTTHFPKTLRNTIFTPPFWPLQWPLSHRSPFHPNSLGPIVCLPHPSHMSHSQSWPILTMLVPLINHEVPRYVMPHTAYSLHHFVLRYLWALLFSNTCAFLFPCIKSPRFTSGPMHSVLGGRRGQTCVQQTVSVLQQVKLRSGGEWAVDPPLCVGLWSLAVLQN